MPSSDLHRLLDEAVNAHGQERVALLLNDLARGKEADGVLTIIANAGIHEIPAQYLRGEVYEASRGNWDATSQPALVAELNQLLRKLADKLRSQTWERVYLVPTGHPVLSLQIKAMVFRMLRMNTIDLYYKAGSYFEIDIDQRAVALAVEPGTPEAEARASPAQTGDPSGT